MKNGATVITTRPTPREIVAITIFSVAMLFVIFQEIPKPSRPLVTQRSLEQVSRRPTVESAMEKDTFLVVGKPQPIERTELYRVFVARQSDGMVFAIVVGQPAGWYQPGEVFTKSRQVKLVRVHSGESNFLAVER